MKESEDVPAEDGDRNLHSPLHDASDNHSKSQTSRNCKHEHHKMRNEIENEIDASSRSETRGDSCPDFEDEDDAGKDEEDDPTDTQDSSHHVRQDSLDQSDKRTFMRAMPSPLVILSVKDGAGPLGILVVPYSDPNRLLKRHADREDRSMRPNRCGWPLRHR